MTQGPQQPWQQQPGWQGGYGPPYGAGPPPAAATNSWALVALILGIITFALSPLPILNQAGILVGIVGVGLSIPAIIIGLRRRVRAVMAFIAAALSVLGLILSFTFTNQYVNQLRRIGSPLDSTVNSGAGDPLATTSAGAAAPRTFTLKVEGSATRATVYYSSNGSSGGGDKVDVPWTNTQNDTEAQFGYATVSASTDSGESGDLTCTITDEGGRVLDQKSAQSQGGSYGSASVNCSANRMD